MKRLDINFINLFSAYHVWEDSNRFYFETDYKLKYYVDFSLDDNPERVAYWFNLVNMSGEASPKKKEGRNMATYVYEKAQK